MSRFIKLTDANTGTPRWIASDLIVEVAARYDGRPEAWVLIVAGAKEHSRFVRESPEEVARLLGWTPPATEEKPASPAGPSPAVDGYGQDETGADYAERDPEAPTDA